jgi:hypothetical protein
MSVEEHVWIRCDCLTCEARTPDHVDRVEARRWAGDHGWMAFMSTSCQVIDRTRVRALTDAWRRGALPPPSGAFQGRRRRSPPFSAYQRACGRVRPKRGPRPAEPSRAVGGGSEGRTCWPLRNEGAEWSGAPPMNSRSSC